MKKLKYLVLLAVAAASFTSCVVRSYGPGWVPGHYDYSPYGRHWVPGHYR